MKTYIPLTNAFDILKMFLSSKGKISRQKFLQLYNNRFGGMSGREGNADMASLFGRDDLFIDLGHGKERPTKSLVTNHENNGRYTHSSFNAQALLDLEWKMIYRRPDNMGLGTAFALAKTFKGKNYHIKLTKSVRRLYRFTFVGGNENNRTSFAEFCRHLNDVLPPIRRRD